jgi:hypothetical protein
MRFLKGKTLSKFSPTDQSLFVSSSGRAVMNIHGALRLPKGTTLEQPDLVGVRVQGGPYGYIRYNTDLNAIEAYFSTGWEVVRAAGGASITRQQITGADGIETTFGPLDQIPDDAKEIMVYVDNVFQHATENYTLATNYLGSGNTYIVFTSPAPYGKPIWIYYGFAN